MNTAMDDGRQESPGEQTLSFRAIRDDDDPAELSGASGRDDFSRDLDGQHAASEEASTGDPATSADAPPSEDTLDWEKPADPDDGAVSDDDAVSENRVASEDVAPHDVASEDVAPHDAASDGAASEDAASEDAASDGAAPEDAAPDGAAPEDRAVSEEVAVEDMSEPSESSEVADHPEPGPLAGAEPDEAEHQSVFTPRSISRDTGLRPGVDHSSGREDASGGEDASSGAEGVPVRPEGVSSGVGNVVSDLEEAGRPSTPEAAERPSGEEGEYLPQPTVDDSPEPAEDAPSAQEEQAASSAGDSAPRTAVDEPGAADAEGDSREAEADDPDTRPEEPVADAAPEAAFAQAGPEGDQEDGEPEPTRAEGTRPEEAELPRTEVEVLPPETVAALTAALDTLRNSVSEVRIGLDLPGAEEARQAQADLLAQLQDYVVPRVRTNTAPALIVVAGSTGAGKSTLVNSLAEKNVSRIGVRRPTTGTPVLACHPDDKKWFAEGELLGGLRRIDAPSPDAGPDCLILTTTEKLPQGVALLDTPDIDSVVEEHHEMAQRLLDAADLWVFVTTAARYADAPAWNLLRLAKERGARLAIVLSRVQPKAREVVLKHFVRMLTEYGLGEIDRFVINESKVADGRLPDNEVTDLRLWLAELSVDGERRAQAIRETLNGVLNSFRTRVPALARHMERQVAFRGELRSDVDTAYRNALAEIDKAFRSGSLVQGEVLARWQDFAGSGDLMRAIQLRRRGRSVRQAPERIMAFRAAMRAGLESVVVAAANRAAEEVSARWRQRSPLGGTLAEGLDQPGDDLVRHAGRAVAAWQEHVTELVRSDGVAKRSVSKVLSFDADSLSLIFMVAMFSAPVEGLQHRLVTALIGAEALRGIGAKALSDLRARIGMLFDEESMRYVQALDSAGIPDESIATRLYQATYNLEVAR